MNQEPVPQGNDPETNATIKSTKCEDGSLGQSSLDAGSLRKRTLINRVVLLVCMVTILFVFIPMIKMFFTPVILASTFAVLFYPLYRKLLRLFRGNANAASLVCCGILILGFIIPATILGALVVKQIFVFYQTVEPIVNGLVRGENTLLFARLEENPLALWLSQLDINWQSTMLDTFKSATTTIVSLVNVTSKSTFQIILGLFVTLFIMFYLFIDGQKIISKFRAMIPLKHEYQNMIINRFLLVSKATIRGTLLIASIQGIMGAIILFAFGVKTWVLWGVVMILLGLIPMVGAWLILVPAGVIHIATGQVWQGIVILALSFGVVSTIDNLLRPRLVGQSARMHDLLIFFSTIGGLAMFGPVGVIVGPAIMAFFVSITEIYSLELQEQFETK